MTAALFRVSRRIDGSAAASAVASEKKRDSLPDPVAAIVGSSTIARRCVRNKENITAVRDPYQKVAVL